MADPVLDIQGLTVALPANADRAHAVADVSLSLFPDEIVCGVVESGPGKSGMARPGLGLSTEFALGNPLQVEVEAGEPDVRLAGASHRRLEVGAPLAVLRGRSHRGGRRFQRC